MISSRRASVTTKPTIAHVLSHIDFLEKNNMAFVNEYATQDDIEKFKLDDLCKRWWGEVPPRHRHAWTFDRTRDAFYIPMRSGREWNSNSTRAVLFYRGVELAVDVALADGSSGMLNESPFRVIWELERISFPFSAPPIPREEIIPVLKEALSAYGYRGIHRQLPNTVVEFKF